MRTLLCKARKAKEKRADLEKELRESKREARSFQKECWWWQEKWSSRSLEKREPRRRRGDDDF